MLTLTLQLLKAEKASKPGTQDITIPWPVLLRTSTRRGADGIPAENHNHGISQVGKAL